MWFLGGVKRHDSSKKVMHQSYDYDECFYEPACLEYLSIKCVAFLPFGRKYVTVVLKRNFCQLTELWDNAATTISGNRQASIPLHLNKGG